MFNRFQSSYVFVTIYSSVLCTVVTMITVNMTFVYICRCCPSTMEHVSINSMCSSRWQTWFTQIIVSSAGINAPFNVYGIFGLFVQSGNLIPLYTFNFYMLHFVSFRLWPAFW